MLHIKRKGNPYYNDNKEMFNLLVKLVRRHPCSYFNLITARFSKQYKCSFRDLHKWIMRMTQHKIGFDVALSTRCTWILHSITSTPKCMNPECNRPFLDDVSPLYRYPKYCKTCVKVFQAPMATKKTVSSKIKSNPHYYDDIVSTRKRTCIDKYGDPNYNNTQKNVDTCNKKYGVSNVFQLDSTKKKSKETKNRKYGDENYTNIKKFNRTMQAKLGVDFPMQSSAVRKQAVKKYMFDNKSFDSADELMYYIWLKDNNIRFEYQPCSSFVYECNGKQHTYQPDFLVENQFIEIKGDHFFKEDGTMCNPYDHSQDDVYEAKHQCMILNNVKIIKSSECKQFRDYFKSKYVNMSHIKSFKQL